MISKILKLDETNNFGFAMTKPLRTGCIKKEKMPPWRKLLNAIDLDGPFGHVFAVNIHFDHKRASVKHILYNEIFSLIIKKRKITDPSKRSVYHLLE